MVRTRPAKRPAISNKLPDYKPITRPLKRCFAATCFLSITLERIFKGCERTFKDCEHTFKDCEQRIHPNENMFPMRCTRLCTVRFQEVHHAPVSKNL